MYDKPAAGRRIKRVLMGIALAAALFLGAVYTGGADAVAADPLEEFEAEQLALQEQMADLKKELNTISQQQKTIGQQVLALDLDIELAEGSVRLSTDKLALIETQVADITEELARTEELLAERTALFEERLVTIYMTGDISLLDVLFKSESFKDFLISYDMLEKMVASDADLLEQIKNDKLLVEQNKSLLEDRLADQKVLKAENEAALEDAVNLQIQKQLMAEQLENDYDYAEAAYKELEETSNEIAEQIRKIQEENARKKMFSGKLSWPLPTRYTRVSSEYGYRTHPVTGKKNSFHTGVDFPAPKGTPIYAAEDGVIIVAGWQGGYGNTVIVDHGGGISTLYGHMSKITAKSGAEVKVGDKIGEVGTTGLSTGNHLHFEVRENGDHVSPWDTYIGRP